MTNHFYGALGVGYGGEDAAQLLNIMENISHPLHHLLVKQQCTFSMRILQLRCGKEHYRKLLLPAAINF